VVDLLRYCRQHRRQQGRKIVFFAPSSRPGVALQAVGAPQRIRTVCPGTAQVLPDDPCPTLCRLSPLPVSAFSAHCALHWDHISPQAASTSHSAQLATSCTRRTMRARALPGHTLQSARLPLTQKHLTGHFDRAQRIAATVPLHEGRRPHLAERCGEPRDLPATPGCTHAILCACVWLRGVPRCVHL